MGLIRRTFITPSGRRWLDDGPGNYDGDHLMIPLGDDVRPAQVGGKMNGGVRARYVNPARLDGNDKIWKLWEPDG